MNEDTFYMVIFVGLVILLAVASTALIAGNIITQLFSSIPFLAGPLGAAVSLTVFVGLCLKIASLLLG